MSKNNVKTFTEGELHFTEDNQLREKYINRVEVLDKVKELFLIPELECMTVVQIAEYYEVDVDVIKRQFQRNEEEFISDGSTIKTSLFFKESFNGTECSIKTGRGKTTIQIDDNVTLVIPNRGIRIFPKRAVLRMGMLLRDSEVAKEAGIDNLYSISFLIYVPFVLSKFFSFIHSSISILFSLIYLKHSINKRDFPVPAFSETSRSFS